MQLRLANYVNTHGIDLVLLAGDLLDGTSVWETGEQLAAALGQMEARVFIAPGNHDLLGPGSAWETVAWPENVHIFREPVTALEVPELCAVVHGAAFTAPEQAESLLAGFAAPADGRVHMGLLHGEMDRRSGMIPCAGRRRSPPAALPIWPWATSTSGRSRCGWGIRSAPGPAARRAGALTSWGRRDSTRARSPTTGGCR
ncbi:MAG: metallophosphoesterase [Dysosmobacter sp.]